MLFKLGVFTFQWLLVVPQQVLVREGGARRGLAQVHPQHVHPVHVLQGQLRWVDVVLALTHLRRRALLLHGHQLVLLILSIALRRLALRDVAARGVLAHLAGAQRSLLGDGHLFAWRDLHLLEQSHEVVNWALLGA